MTNKALLILPLLALCSCGEDRSGEQPFAPTVRTLSAAVDGTSVTFNGTVLASPNSKLSACGFVYGTSRTALTSKAVVATPANTFALRIDTLASGTYYYAATATNGIGTTYGDTLSVSF